MSNSESEIPDEDLVINCGRGFFANDNDQANPRMRADKTETRYLFFNDHDDAEAIRKIEEPNQNDLLGIKSSESSSSSNQSAFVGQANLEVNQLLRLPAVEEAIQPPAILVSETERQANMTPSIQVELLPDDLNMSFSDDNNSSESVSAPSHPLEDSAQKS